jgi:proline iminopeptidase
MLAPIVVLFLLALVVFGVWFWYSMKKPLYQPGMVREGKHLRAPLAPPEQTADGEFWQVEQDVQLYHFAAGEGRNVLVVHGGPGYPYTEPWPGLAPLTNDYRFHYYDQRGCGQSTRPIDRFASGNFYNNVKALDEALGIGAQLADIGRIRQILGEETLILVGHSFGGFLAALYAAEFPARVAALVLIAPADVLVMPQESGGLFEEVRRRLPQDMQDDYDAYLKDYMNFRGIFSKSDSDLAALNQEFARYYEAIVTPTSIPAQGQAGGWMVQALYFSMGLRHDYRQALQAVDAPVLVVHGADDLQTEPASRVYADAFPNSNFRVISNVAHFPFHGQPEEFTRVVGEFLAEKVDRI